MKPRPPAPMTTIAEFKEAMAKAGKPVQSIDVNELAAFVLQGIRDEKYIISRKLDQVGELLHARADAISRGELPQPLHPV